MKGGLYHIIFVCTGNICRSPMAEGILRNRLSNRSAEFSSVSSAGLAAAPGLPASTNSVLACRRSSIDISGHRSRPLTAAQVDSADLLLVMEDHHRQAILRQWPGAADRTFLLSEFGADGAGGPHPGVDDPIGQDLDTYVQVFDTINRYVTRALPRIETSIAEAARSA